MKKIICVYLLLTLLATGCGLQSTSGASSGTSAPNDPASTQPKTSDTSQRDGKANTASTQAKTAPQSSKTSTSSTSSTPSASHTPVQSQTTATTPQPVIANPPPGAESVTPDTVVKEYYATLARQDYNDAWSFMHPSVQANPSGYLTQDNFIADQKKWTAKLVQAQTIQLLDQYKIYCVQISFANVEVVKATFDNGQTKMIHLVLDEHNRWKMFWGPDGIE